MDCEGILKAWTTKGVPKSARRTVTRSDSAYSRSEVRPRAAAPAVAISVSATVAAGTVSSLMSLPGLHAAELFQRLLGGRLLGFFLVGAGSGGRHPARAADLHQKLFRMIGGLLLPDRGP